MSDPQKQKTAEKRCVKKVILALFIASYAIFLSLGMECLMNLFSVFFAISLDGGAIAERYPRFIPFLVIIGFLALVALVSLVVLNLITSEKSGYTKRTWYIQYIFAFVMAIPLLKIWEICFDFLRNVF